MSARLRGAIVGYGHVADSGHMPFWLGAPGVEIVAAVDTDAARQALFRARVAGGRSYPSVGELLAEERVDIVDICT